MVVSKNDEKRNAEFKHNYTPDCFSLKTSVVKSGAMSILLYKSVATVVVGERMNIYPFGGTAVQLTIPGSFYFHFFVYFKGFVIDSTLG